MKVETDFFRTVDDGNTICITPGGSRRQKPSWYIWMKEDGSGMLVIDSKGLRIDLPANSTAKDPVQVFTYDMCSQGLKHDDYRDGFLHDCPSPDKKRVLKSSLGV